MTTLLDEIRDGNGLSFAAGARELHVHPATFGRWARRPPTGPARPDPR
jgi:hypothetical protein